MSGYIVDDQALLAGLISGNEQHRRELSRLLHDAVGGGPPLDIPALCLTAAAVKRPDLARHLADIIAAAPPGAIDVCGLTRTTELDALHDLLGRLGWPAIHAVARACTAGLPVLTVDPARYVEADVEALAL